MRRNLSHLSCVSLAGLRQRLCSGDPHGGRCSRKWHNRSCLNIYALLAYARLLAVLLQDRLRPYVVAYLQDLPQWAYVPCRGTLDAAIRVQAHCQQVQAACHSDGWTVREARAGLARPKQQAGGLQVSLDLSAAFDSLEWQHIATALADADVPSELHGQILEWHRGITYHLQIQGQSLEIAASRGLRQGCLIAPLVWALVTGRFLYLLALETDPTWLAQDVTAYADDFHAGSSVDSIAGLDLLYRRLGSMLDVLTDAGLTINALKSAVLYRFRGSFATRWLKQCLRETKEGSLFRLRTPKGRLFEFPVVLVHTYLGTKISYHDPRTQTMRYRMQLAQLEWPRLRKVNGPSMASSWGTGFASGTRLCLLLFSMASLLLDSLPEARVNFVFCTCVNCGLSFVALRT